MKNIQSGEVHYEHQGLQMTGSAAWDAASEERRPVVLVVHEWWGRNDYARRRAEMLAELGYLGFAVDLYGGGRTAANPDEAGEWMSALLGDRSVMRGRFHAALEAARTLEQADPQRAAAIGYCMGGGVVLHMARTGSELAAVASFHGALPLAIAQPGEDAKVKAGRRGCFSQGNRGSRGGLPVHSVTRRHPWLHQPRSYDEG